MVTTVTKYIAKPNVTADEQTYFSSVKKFCDWVTTKDLIALDQMIDCEVHANQTIPNVASQTTAFSPATYDATRYARMHPAPGLGVNELETSGAFDYGASGIELTLSNVAGWRLGNGATVEGFRINVVDGGTTGSNACAINLSRGASLPGGQTDARVPVLRNCRIKSNANAAAEWAVRTGEYTSSGSVTDNVFIQTAGSAACALVSGTATFARNSFVRRGAAAGTTAVVGNTSSGGAKLQDCVIVGGGTTPLTRGSLATSGSNVSNNYADSGTASYGLAISTPLVVDSASDLRPASGSAIIGTGAVSSRDTFDMRGAYRGQLPDIGAVQRTAQALPALVVPTITSQVLSSLDLTISGTYTGTPWSGSVTLLPADSNPGGATQATKAITFGSGTFSVTISQVAVGQYKAPALTFTNAAGLGPAATGGSAFSVTLPGIPELAITQQYITGQRVVLEGTVTGSPTSMSATLEPTATPNGAVSTTATSVTFGTGTWRAIFDRVPNGNYQLPSIAAINGSGMGVLSSGSGVVIAVPIPTDTTGVIYRRIGGAAFRTDDTLAAFGTWLQSQNLVTQQVKVIAYVYEDQPLLATKSAKLVPANWSDQYNVTVMPPPGCAVWELDTTGPLYYPDYLGIELEYTNTYPVLIGCGVAVEGFKLKEQAGTGTGAGINMTRTNAAPSGNTSYTSWLRRNRILRRGASSVPLISAGEYTSRPEIDDNIIIDEAGTGLLINSLYYGFIRRNSFVRSGGGAGATAIQATTTANTFDSNVFVGCGGAPISASGTSHTYNDNYTDTALTTPQAGITAITSGPVINSYTDLRTVDGTPIIGGGGPSGNTTLDIRGGNRGSDPDAGAYQLHPAMPLPGLTITSIVVDGQTVTVSGTSTNSPTSGLATLSPSGADTVGAVQQGPTALTLGAGTFSVQWVGVPAGEYLSPYITATNAGGLGAPATGGTSVSIIGISATAEYPVSSGYAVATLTSAVAAGPTLSLSGTATNAPFAGTVTVRDLGGATVAGPYAMLVDEAGFSGAITGLQGGAVTLSVSLENAAGVGTTAFPDVITLVDGIVGTLAVIDAGSDVVSMVGAVSPPVIYGTLSVVDTGSDTVSMAGVVSAPAITGTLAVVDSGADVVSMVGAVSAPAPVDALTLAQARAYLASLGLDVPSDMLDDALATVATAVPAMIAAGYDGPTMRRVQRMAVALVAAPGGPRRIASQGAPSGAARAFKYGDGDFSALRRSLRALDTAGTVAELVGPDPAAAAALMFVV